MAAAINEGNHHFRQAVRELGQAHLSRRPVVIASNRGPVEYRQTADGLQYSRGQGGLVTAVSAVASALPATWVSAPFSATDRELALRGEVHTVPFGESGAPLHVSFVAPAPEEYAGYYDTIANSLLWFLQHGIHHSPDSPDIDLATWRAWHHYRKVNRRFADAIIAACKQQEGRPFVMIHDYHLYLVPAMVRQALPDATILHFTHIPWPAPDQWRLLPREMRHSVIRSLLDCDLVGFNTQRYADQFTLAAREFLGADVDPDSGAIRYAGRQAMAKGYPVAVDTGDLLQFAGSPAVAEAEQALLGEGQAEYRILQVARTDPSKNLLRSLKAIDALLESEPGLKGKLVFWGLFPTSRQTVDKYQSYLRQLKALAERVNERHGEGDWQPIKLYLDNSYTRGVAAMKHYDVLLVNSLADGMNLVAKEGAIVNRRHGVTVLSETAGVTEELGPWGLVVNPYDVHDTAAAIRRGLTMPQAHRAELLARQQAHLASHDVYRWAHDQLVDLLAAEATPASTRLSA